MKAPMPRKWSRQIRVTTNDLGRLVNMRRNLDDQITAQVASCRDAGATWDMIAKELGISRQAAQKRYDRKLPL